MLVLGFSEGVEREVGRGKLGVVRVPHQGRGWKCNVVRRRKGGRGGLLGIEKDKKRRRKRNGNRVRRAGLYRGDWREEVLGRIIVVEV